MSSRLPSVVYPQFDAAGEPLVYDSNGEPVEEPRERLRGCRCGVPCLSFKCVSSHHRGPRATPWCRGGDDQGEMEALGYDLEKHGYVGRCDDCWRLVMDRNGH